MAPWLFLEERSSRLGEKLKKVEKNNIIFMRLKTAKEIIYVF